MSQNSVIILVKFCSFFVYYVLKYRHVVYLFALLRVGLDAGLGERVVVAQRGGQQRLQRAGARQLRAARGLRC